MVRPGDLQDRDFDRNEPRGADAVHADMVERVKGRQPARTLEQRIAEARSLTPPDDIEGVLLQGPAESARLAWTAGRDAALKAIEG